MLTIRAAWMADNKAAQLHRGVDVQGQGRAARSTISPTKRVELAATAGFSETSLLEKWARDAKILDIFEGTQQIQQLIIARRLLGKSSAELK